MDYNTTDDTALAGSDYTTNVGKVTFAPGVTTRTILVPIIDDATVELTEAFEVTLSGAVGATIAAGQGVGTGTIVDDDGVQNDPNTLYVYDIDFGSRKHGREWRAVFEIRSDSNANGLGDSLDLAASGVSVTVVFAGRTYSGTTDANGIFRSGWIKNLSSGDHYANVVDLALTGFDWNSDLDLEDDSDGILGPDAVLSL